MKWRVMAAVALLSLALTGVASANLRADEAVELCHMGRTITIDAAAADRHVDLHGDSLDACVNGGAQGGPPFDVPVGPPEGSAQGPPDPMPEPPEWVPGPPPDKPPLETPGPPDWLPEHSRGGKP